jgi:ribosomal protein L14E/L6E/L27E
MTYQELQTALRIFGLGERATLRDIKTRHRELAKRHHPDVEGNRDSEEIRAVNAAHRLLLEYVRSYRFCFSQEEFLEQRPEERVREQFREDPVWGKN